MHIGQSVPKNCFFFNTRTSIVDRYARFLRHFEIPVHNEIGFFHIL